MLVLSGSSSKNFSFALSKELNAKYLCAEVKRFPDDECYVRIPKFDDKKVILVQNAYPDAKIVELLLLLDALKEFELEKLILVVPYMGYARQDKKFNEGEAISARAIAKAIGNCDFIVTVDIHNPEALKFFSIPFKNTTAIKLLGSCVKNFDIDIAIAPDDGALEKAKLLGKEINCKWTYLEKKRIDGTSVSIKQKKLDVKQKNVVIVDDIISTGGTIVATAELLRKNGAKKVLACCVHGLFAKNAIEKLEKWCDDIISTDTIENEKTRVSAAPAVVDCIRKLV
ncbi:MAG: ribose-phosphate diphosphokinase [Candidatus Thermoplasmatota archaeon]